MKFKANPRQALQVFSMLFGETPEEREPKWGKAIVEKSDREVLVKAKLLRSERRGRSNHLVLTDEAWDWAVDNLDTPLPKAQQAVFVLHNVLTKLAIFLRQSDRSLAEVVNGSARQAPPAKDTGEELDLESTIRKACLSLTQGKTKERVRLKDLRTRVAASREALDATLLHMQRCGTLILMRLDNPAELSAEDEAAALSIAGNPRHLLYLEA